MLMDTLLWVLTPQAIAQEKDAGNYPHVASTGITRDGACYGSESLPGLYFFASRALRIDDGLSS